MAKSLGGLAALADYGSSMSEDSESESEVEVVAKFDIKKNHETIEIDDLSTSADESSDTEEVAKFDTLEKFIKNGLLNSIVKESVRRVEYAKSINYRNHETIEIDDSTSSSDESSDSDSSSDTDSDFLNLDEKDPTKLHVQEQPKRRKQPPTVRGELLLSDLPPIEDLQISVQEYECLKMGVIKEVVEEMVVVQADLNNPALDLDTVLFLEKGQRPLGKVFDVMGPVVQPFYCVRFNSKEHIQEKNIAKGAPVFYAPKTDHTAFVYLSELFKMKGSDASWENNHEPPPSHQDFSDDEQERNARKGKKRQFETPTMGPYGPVQERTYVPPTGQARSNNAFYRRERHYNPRNYGPITYNSVHTQHMQPQLHIRAPPQHMPPQLHNQPPPPHMPPNPNLNSSHTQQYNNPPPMYFPYPPPPPPPHM